MLDHCTSWNVVQAFTFHIQSHVCSSATATPERKELSKTSSSFLGCIVLAQSYTLPFGGDISVPHIIQVNSTVKSGGVYCCPITSAGVQFTTFLYVCVKKAKFLNFFRESRADVEEK